MTMGNSRRDRRYLISEESDEPRIFRLPNADDAAAFSKAYPAFRVVKWQWIAARYPQISPHDAKEEAIGAWAPDEWLSPDGKTKPCERYVPVCERAGERDPFARTWYASYKGMGYVEIARFENYMDRETFCTAQPEWRACKWRDVTRGIPGTFRYCRSSHDPFWTPTSGEFCGREIDYVRIRLGEDGRRCPLED